MNQTFWRLERTLKTLEDLKIKTTKESDRLPIEELVSATSSFYQVIIENAGVTSSSVLN